MATTATAALPSRNPPLLLTKRLTSFLHAHQTADLPTLLLISPHGKLLAHASRQPVSVLRTHATVAASLLAIHTSSYAVVPSSLPSSRTPDPIASPSPSYGSEDDEAGEGEEEEGDDGGSFTGHVPSDENIDRARAPKSSKPVKKPYSITVQLSAGTVVIRRLRCGLLLVAVGSAIGDGSEPPPPPHRGTGIGGEATTAAASASNTAPPSPSEADSMISVDAQTTTTVDSVAAAGVMALRRQASELARWLDDKLGSLTVPEEGVGVE